MRRAIALFAVSTLVLCTGCRSARPYAADSPDAPATAAARPASGPDACCPCEIGGWPEAPCGSTYVEGSLNFLPNVGFGLRAGRVFHRSSRILWSAEVGGVLQPIDDKAFIDDEGEAAGDWYQVQAGLKAQFAPTSRRHLTIRAGGIWFRATGEPNIVNEAGDYFGLYGGIGYEADITSSLTVGPELSLLLGTQTGEFNARPIPQLSWRATWWLDRKGCLERAPYGELYADATAALSPGIGGGLSFG